MISSKRFILPIAIFTLILASGACKEERKSVGQKPNVEAEAPVDNNVIMVDGEKHLKPKKPMVGGYAEDDDYKSQKLVNQLTNYTIGLISERQEAPADLDELKTLIKQRYGLNWPKDPWGEPYRYEKTGDTDFVITSSGPDKVPGNEDDVRATNLGNER